MQSQDRGALWALCLLMGSVLFAATLTTFAGDDTAAQWLQAATGILALIASIFGVVLVRQTLRETQRTAEAAIEANAVARDMAERQLRAYVGGGSVRKLKFDAEAGRLSFIYVGINTGQTPARQYRSGVGTFSEATFDNGWFDEIDQGLSDPAGNSSQVNIGAGRQFEQPHSVSADPSVWAMIDSGERTMWIISSASYFDVFGRRHTSRSKRFILPGTLFSGLPGIAASPDGNSES